MYSMIPDSDLGVGDLEILRAPGYFGRRAAWIR
jgi:hypothetical protein